MIRFVLLPSPLSFSTHHHTLGSFSSKFQHYRHLCMTLYGLLISFSNWFNIKRVFLTLAALKSRSNAKTMTSAWQLIKTGLHIFFCIWGPIMCKLKGKTPQEGINRRQSGDRARHGDQMAERQPLRVQSVLMQRRRRAEDGTALDP